MILGYTMSRYIIKAMYQEKPKRLIIWNGGEYIATKKTVFYPCRLRAGPYDIL